jgi:hypothetical protein
MVYLDIFNYLGFFFDCKDIVGFVAVVGSVVGGYMEFVAVEVALPSKRSLFHISSYS